MTKALALYAVALILAGLAVWQPDWELLLPLAVYGLLPLGLVWVWRSEGRSFLALGLWRENGWSKNFLTGLLIGLAVPTVWLVIQIVAGWIILSANEWSAALWARKALGVIEILILTFIEELIFRGYFYQRASFNGSRRQAVMLSSVLFALLHIPSFFRNGLPLNFFPTTLMSIAILGSTFAIGFARTGNRLWLPWGLHLGYNFSSSALGGLFQIAFVGPIWLIGNPAWTPESGGLGLLLGGIIFAAVWWLTKSESGLQMVRPNT